MDEGARGGSVVCGVDDSERSREGIAVAARFARRLGLRLVLVHAGRTPPLPATPPIGVAYPPDLEERLRAVALDAGRRLLDQQAEAAGVTGWEPRVLVGPPAPTLVEVAHGEHAAMLVVAPRGLGALASAVLGSVSSEVVARAACPVVVVPAGLRSASDPGAAPSPGAEAGTVGPPGSPRAAAESEKASSWTLRA